MITVGEAKSLIEENVHQLPPLSMPILEAAGHVLAADVVATVDIPSFRQSSVDGYAFCFAEDQGLLTIIGESAAGSQQHLTARAGEAVRIFTGAPLPEGADTVVMQEKADVEKNRLVIKDGSLREGSNVRAVGSEVTKGSIAMKAGDLLTPAAVGFLAGIGESEVPVYPSPLVHVLVTGNELQSPGLPLRDGQVYESNSFLLRAALQDAGIRNVRVTRVADDLPLLQERLEQALHESDVVLLTGGVSVGDYDFVVEAARRSKVQTVFHKVRQRPGKPLYFGMQDRKVVFGLPGNPSSVLSCFYHYVLPALGRLCGKTLAMKGCTAPLSHAVVKPKGLTTFLKGRYAEGVATPLGAQESFRLSSFAQANCLIGLQEEKTNVGAGELVDVYLLPGID